MPSDERLREALLEVQALRERESRALRESNSLLRLSEDMAKATDQNAVLDVLLRMVGDLTGAQAVCVLRQQDGAFVVDRALVPITVDRPSDVPVGIPVGTTLPRQINIFAKPRNVVDLGAVPDWHDQVPAPLAAFRSLLSCPLPGESPLAVICLHEKPAAFAAGDLEGLRKMLSLASQALSTVALSTTNRLLAAVIEGSSSGFSIANARDPNRPLIFVNRAFEEMTGYSAADVLGSNCRFLSNDPPDAEERTRLRKTVAQNGAGRFLLRNKRRNGEPFWNDLTLFPVLAADGQADYLVATQTEATIRVEAQRERDLARARMDEALAHTNDALILLGPDQRVEFRNTATVELFAAKGLDWAIGSSFSDNWQAYLDGLPRSFFPLPDTMERPDLEALAARPDGTGMRLPDGRNMLIRAQRTAEDGLVVSATNVTALKTAQRLLRQRAAAVENAQDGIGIVEASGRILYANTALAQLLGAQSSSRILGRKWLTHYEAPTEEQMLQLAQLSEKGSAKLLLERSEGAARHYHELSLTAVERVGTVIVARDVTGRIEDQLRRAELNKQLEQSRRQEAIGQLAAGIAHDFNNLLSAINGSAMLISTDPAITDEVRRHADRISKAGISAAKLVNRMLDLGATQLDAGVFDLRSVFDDAKGLLTGSIRPGIQLDLCGGDVPLRVEGVPNDAIQVIVNLVLNANDALDRSDGIIAVSLSRFEADHLPPVRVGTLTPGRRYAVLCVRDNGEGMTAATLDDAFSAYFSTKGERGTGIGLAMVSTIITRTGGAIAVRSTVGEGSVFEIYWPLWRANEEPASNTPDATARMLTGATILLVDDDRNVTDVLASYLEQLGAEVSAVDDPTLALEVIADDPAGWSIVLSDYDMPEMSGGELVAEIRKITTDLPILIVTALARRFSDPRISTGTVQGVFAKPVNMLHLSNAIAELLYGTEGT